MLQKEGTPIPVLQLSLRRAGSTTLYRALIAHPDIDGPSEPFSFHTRTNSDGSFDNTDPLSPIIYRPAQSNPREELSPTSANIGAEAFILQHILSYFTSNSPDLPNVRLAKETLAALQLGFLLELLPENMRILHLTRDPRAIAASYKTNDLFQRWGIRRLFLQLQTTVQGNHKLNTLYPDLMNIDPNTAPWTEVLTRKIIFFQSEISRHLSDRENVLPVAFEDFIVDPREVIRQILTWIGVSPLSPVIEHAASFTQSHRNESRSLMHPLYQRRHPHDWVLDLTDDEIDSIKQLAEQYKAKLVPVDREQMRNIARAYRYDEISSTKFSLSLKRKTGIPDRTQLVQEIYNSLRPIKTETHSFFMAAFPVTNRQFLSFLVWLAQRPLAHDTSRYLLYNPQRGRIKKVHGDWVVKAKYLKHPVTSVTWLGATLFAFWVSLRLPSLDEWLAAYRMSKSHEFLSTNANFNQEYDGTTPVGYFQPDTIGLYDMYGNIYEWTGTRISPESAATPGGSWQDSPFSITNHTRRSAITALSEKDIGFRLATDTAKAANHLVPDHEIASIVQKIIRNLENPKISFADLNSIYSEILSLLQSAHLL